MGPTPILEMARAYGLRPRLWLLVAYEASENREQKNTAARNPKDWKRFTPPFHFNSSPFIYGLALRTTSLLVVSPRSLPLTLLEQGVGEGVAEGFGENGN